MDHHAAEGQHGQQGKGHGDDAAKRAGDGGGDGGAAPRGERAEGEAREEQRSGVVERREAAREAVVEATTTAQAR
jgi:hypothetical protein